MHITGHALLKHKRSLCVWYGAKLDNPEVLFQGWTPATRPLSKPTHESIRRKASLENAETGLKMKTQTVKRFNAHQPRTARYIQISLLSRLHGLLEMEDVALEVARTL